MVAVKGEARQREEVIVAKEFGLEVRLVVSLIGKPQQRLAVHHPVRQGIVAGEGGRDKRDAVHAVGAHETLMEKAASGLILPGRKRYGRIDVLQLTLELQQIGSVPGNEAGATMRDVRPEIAFRPNAMAHRGEPVDVDETLIALHLAMQFRQGAQELSALAIFAVGELTMVLADAHHRGRCSRGPVALPSRTSMMASLSAVLARGKLPATTNVTQDPSLGSTISRVAPVAVEPGATVASKARLPSRGVVRPAGTGCSGSFVRTTCRSVSAGACRIRAGAGAQVR